MMASGSEQGFFDYESISTLENSETTNTMNYARAATKDVFPKKEQGIVIEYKDESLIADYVVAVGTIGKPKNMVFASTIANKKVGIFLSSKEITAKFLMENKIITVNKRQLKLESLATKNKRIILSNVSPMIPHNEIEMYLDSYIKDNFYEGCNNNKKWRR